MNWLVKVGTATLTRDCLNLLRPSLHYIVSVEVKKIHTLEGVGCRRIQSWMEDIMIRATSTVRRNATPEELKDAKRKRKAAERKGEALLKKKTRPGDGSTAMQLQKQLEHQNWRVSVISHLRHLFTPLKSCEENSRRNKLVS